jgi:hypothetical protein
MAGTRKGTYKITNWREYNESLVRRGSITYWFSDEVLAEWRHTNRRPRRGHPFVYSDTAIECLLSLRELFRLPYRQTEGLARSLVELMEIALDIPDYTSLAKRAATLGISLDVSRHAGPIDVVVDSTGLKVYGEGEWKVRIHGKTKHRTWRKLHLTVNPKTQEIEAEVLTENSGHDADQVDAQLDAVAGRIRRFYGDGSYDPWKVRETLAKRGIKQIIPPRRDAKIKRHANRKGRPLPRDVAIRDIRRLGRRGWKESIGYHLRSLAETAMYRIKCCFGNRLKNRILATQKTEARLRTKILNHFTRLGLPQFVWN